MRWKWLLAAAAVVALFVAGRLLSVEQWLKAFQAWVAGKGLVGAAAYTAVYVVSALLFVPGSVLTIGAGLLFGLAWGTVLVSIASTTAAALAFLIARYVARGRVQRLAERNPKFGALDRAVAEQGWKVVALLRLSPLIPFSLSNYLYGLTPVRFGSYVLTSWIAMLPGTFLYVYLGAAGSAAVSGRGPGGAWRTVLWVAGLLATIAVTVLVTRAARRQLEKTPLAAAR
ncbi:MAG TPA: TVP38/TMEM64 family protein [Vicinamibacteria bacterium]